jgi:putative drug exporter of the RND superfamily
VSDDPSQAAAVDGGSPRCRVQQRRRPPQRQRATLTPGQLTALHVRLGEPRALPALPPRVAASQQPSGPSTARSQSSALLHIVPIAIAAIAILLALVLRSLIAPLYLIASVAISYRAAFGLSVLFFSMRRSRRLNYFVPFLLFVFLLAFGEDYTILVMNRIREEVRRIPLRQAVTAALERTGSMITSAGLMLAGTFGVFALVVARQPGGGVYVTILATLAIGILMDAFAVRTLLVPATVALLGRWNWWPTTHGTPAQPTPARDAKPASVHGRPPSPPRP